MALHVNMNVHARVNMPFFPLQALLSRRPWQQTQLLTSDVGGLTLGQKHHPEALEKT
jgi:hypothetical protein